MKTSHYVISSAFALIVVASVHVPAHGQDPTVYCPLLLMGQWNGAYQYYCVNCNVSVYNVVYTDRLHTTGTGSDNNPDPIIKILKKDYEPKNGELLIRPQLRIHNFSGHQKKNVESKYDRAGVGEAENGTFFASSPRCAPASDFLLKVTN